MKKRILSIILNLILINFINCINLPLANSTDLPTVQMQQFTPGKYWTWVYYHLGNLDAPYSYEKYTVEKVEQNKITLILSSKFAPTEEFQVRQKFEVDLKKCHAAYSQRNFRKPWSLKSYYLAEGKWELVELSGKTLAFEEKFNCHSYSYVQEEGERFHTTFLTATDPRFGEVSLFQQRDLFMKRDSSRFINDESFADGQLDGVTYSKDFNANDPQHFYMMRLEDWN